MAGGPYRRENLGTEVQKIMWRNIVRRWPSKPRGDLKQILPSRLLSQLSETTNPADTLISDFKSSRPWGNTFLRFKPPILQYFAISALVNTSSRGLSPILLFSVYSIFLGRSYLLLSFMTPDFFILCQAIFIKNAY